MADPIIDLLLDANVFEVTRGSCAGDHRVVVDVRFPSPDSNTPQPCARIVIPVETLDQAREAGARLNWPMRLTLRLEEVRVALPTAEVSRG